MGHLLRLVLALFLASRIDALCGDTGCVDTDRVEPRVSGLLRVGDIALAARDRASRPTGVDGISYAHFNTHQIPCGTGDDDDFSSQFSQLWTELYGSDEDVVDPLTLQEMTWQSLLDDPTWPKLLDTLDMNMTLSFVRNAGCACNNLLGLRQIFKSVRESSDLCALFGRVCRFPREAWRESSQQRSLLAVGFCFLVYELVCNSMAGKYMTVLVFFLHCVAANEPATLVYKALPDGVDDLFARMSFAETTMFSLPLVVIAVEIFGPDVIWMFGMAQCLSAWPLRTDNFFEIVCLFGSFCSRCGWFDALFWSLSCYGIMRARPQRKGVIAVVAILKVTVFMVPKYRHLLSATQILRALYWSFQLLLVFPNFTGTVLGARKLVDQLKLAIETKLPREQGSLYAAELAEFCDFVIGYSYYLAFGCAYVCGAWEMLEIVMNVNAADGVAFYIVHFDRFYALPSFTHLRIATALLHTYWYGFRHRPCAKAVLFVVVCLGSIAGGLVFCARRIAEAEPHTGRTGAATAGGSEMARESEGEWKVVANFFKNYSRVRGLAEFNLQASPGARKQWEVEAKAGLARRREAEANATRKAEIVRQVATAREREARRETDAKAARKAAEEKATREGEKMALLEAEEQAARARQKAGEQAARARQKAEAKAARQAEKAARERRQAEAKAAREAEVAHRKVEAKKRAQAEAEAQWQREAEMKTAREATATAEAKAREQAEAEARRRREAATDAVLKNDEEGASDSRLLAFLTSIGQEHALKLFVQEDVDLETLQMCKPPELSDMLTSLGLKMGARKKFMNALSASSTASTSSEIDRLNRQAEDSAKHQERLELELSAHRAQLDKLRGAMKQSGVPREYECPIRCAHYPVFCLAPFLCVCVFVWR